MSSEFTILIPARYASTRLPGKPLLEIAGKSLLQHVYESARTSAARNIYIATDDERIRDHCESFHADVVMTAATHVSGTDRLAEAVDQLQLDDNTIVVNLQGDEIGMSANVINQVAQLLSGSDTAGMATVCEPIADTGLIADPNVVKVVANINQEALYFSRSVIPSNIRARATQCYKHIGLYAYRCGFLRRFTRLPVCELEQQESLEQLRALYHGETILVEAACEPTGIGVDTAEDLERARQQFSET